MSKHEKIHYLEFPANDLELNKKFFTEVFNWLFTDYGPEYTAFSNAGIEGGFFKADLYSSTKNGAALTVFYSDRLEDTMEKIVPAGGQIVKEIFSFPGGRRFHFLDPCNNEFAVWTEATD